MSIFSRGLIVLCFFVSAKNSFALSAMSIPCPQKFIGNVVEVKELPMNHGNEFQEVKFKIINSNEPRLTSTSLNQSFDTLKIVKDGPVRFELNHTYEVSKNDVYLCHASEMKKQI